MLEFDFREFKKLRRLLEPKGHFQIGLCGRLIVMFYQIGEESFHLIGTNSFPIEAENEGYKAASSRCP